MKTCKTNALRTSSRNDSEINLKIAGPVDKILDNVVDELRGMEVGESSQEKNENACSAELAHNDYKSDENLLSSIVNESYKPQTYSPKLASENSVVRRRADSIFTINSQKIFRIAIVDDSDLSRKLLSKLLKNHTYFSKTQYKLYEAVDGLDAVSTLHGRLDHISIIFMDNIMPTVTGVLASKIIRGLGYKRLIFGITGNGLKEDIHEFIENGADYVFIKPFKKEKLDMIFELIDTYGNQRIEGKRITETPDKKGLIWI
jgi:CheY-like chemotaxis protein